MTLRGVHLKLVMCWSKWLSARLDFFIHEVMQLSSPEGSFSLNTIKINLFRCFVKLSAYQILSSAYSDRS